MSNVDNIKLKLSKLPQTKPTRRTITLLPELDADLRAYAKIYEEVYGDKQDINNLIPSMLAGFLASDAGFRKAKRKQS